RAAESSSEAESSRVAGPILARAGVVDLVRVLTLDAARGGFASQGRGEPLGEAERQSRAAAERRHSVFVGIEEVGRTLDDALATEIIARGVREERTVLLEVVLGGIEDVELVEHPLRGEIRHAAVEHADDSRHVGVILEHARVAEGMMRAKVSDVAVESVHRIVGALPAFESDSDLAT